MSRYVPVYELQPGDQFVGYGPNWFIVSVKYGSSINIGGDVERQRYNVTVRQSETRKTRTLQYSGESKVHII